MIPLWKSSIKLPVELPVELSPLAADPSVPTRGAICGVITIALAITVNVG